MRENYTHGHHASVLRSHRWRTAENSAAYLLDSLSREARLLDAGCGPGTITADLAGRVDRVIAVDASASVVAEARRHAAERGAANVDFQVADGYALPFRDAAFDVVHAHQVLQHLADPVAALREWRRVCRAGGQLAARDAVYGAMTWHPRVLELDDWRELYDAVARHNGGEPDAGDHLQRWALAAGFGEVNVTSSTWRFDTDEERAWWSRLWAERVTDSGLARTAIDAGLADRAELERLARGWRRWGAEPDAWFEVPHGEIRCRR